MLNLPSFMDGSGLNLLHILLAMPVKLSLTLSVIGWRDLVYVEGKTNPSCIKKFCIVSL